MGNISSYSVEDLSECLLTHFRRFGQTTTTENVAKIRHNKKKGKLYPGDKWKHEDFRDLISKAARKRPAFSKLSRHFKKTSSKEEKVEDRQILTTYQSSLIQLSWRCLLVTAPKVEIPAASIFIRMMQQSAEVKTIFGLDESHKVLCLQVL